LLGAKLTAVDKTEPTMLRDCTASEVVNGLPGKTIRAVERLGKFMVVRLDGKVFLTLHLGMTGQLLVDPPGGDGHTRFVFRLSHDDGAESTLEFRDIRKFGRLHLTVGAPAPRLLGLGPDAWRGEWDAEYLKRRLGTRRSPLKAFLLDQRHVAGIGNIYADEILWWTRLSPLRPSGSLTAEEIGGLAMEIRTRLGEGVRLLGCTLSDFVDTMGQQGGFQNWLRAYGKQGQVCSRCGDTFLRTIVAGRGTSYCPGCQH
jgi:formamidopyrimidine-DNA glycosylase